MALYTEDSARACVRVHTRARARVSARARARACARACARARAVSFFARSSENPLQIQLMVV